MHWFIVRNRAKTCIPAVKTPAGLNVVGGGSLAAPGSVTPAVNMEAITTISVATHIVMQSDTMSWHTQSESKVSTCTLNCSPRV